MNIRKTKDENKSFCCEYYKIKFKWKWVRHKREGTRQKRWNTWNEPVTQWQNKEATFSWLFVWLMRRSSPAGYTASRWLSHTDWVENGLPEDSLSPTGRTATGLELRNHIWSPRCPFEHRNKFITTYLWQSCTYMNYSSTASCTDRAALILHRAADLLDLLWR